MTAHILVVDDEPDVEALVLQKFRHKIRDGAISFLFARDGVEALAALKAAYLRLVASTAFPSSTGFAGTTGVPPKLSRSVANRCASAVSACRRSRLF